jgi:hypothetical protein
MKKASLFLATALLCSSALFAQESSSTPAQSSTTQSTTTTTTETTKTKLTADQKAELKSLHEKVRTECKADKTSDACKQAKADLKSKREEFGMSTHHSMKHKKGAAASTTDPS